MKSFAQLYLQIDQTQRTGEKVRLLEQYFRRADPKDACWALYFLAGNTPKRPVKGADLRRWVAEASGYPLWMIEECQDVVGDLAETLALLFPFEGASEPPALAVVVEEVLLPMKDLTEGERRERLIGMWRTLTTHQRLVFNKLLTGEFRLGIQLRLVIRALSKLSHIAEPELAHRLSGKWYPSEEAYRSLFLETPQARGIAHPYPFFLAHPLQEARFQDLGSSTQWQFEWKWDGIRAQVIRREGETVIWSRGEEVVNQAFPELVQASFVMPNGTVLDGEILAWKGERPAPFSDLQQRTNRKKVTEKLVHDVPVCFMIYDLLELNGEDIRNKPLIDRRDLLTKLYHESCSRSSYLRLSQSLTVSSWQDAIRLRNMAREEQVEGLVLKRCDSVYGVGRPRGVWWKWKIEPYSVDAVLIYAQKGQGRRADLYTDYTFGLWHEGELVPIAKAYSGLSDAEIREVDQFVRSNTVERFGPVRSVEPKLVFELFFDDVRVSKRHKSGFAVRFPRISRWRKDKTVKEADALKSLSALAGIDAQNGKGSEEKLFR